MLTTCLQSSPASESPSSEIDLAEQDQDETTTPPVIRVTPPPSATEIPPDPTLFDLHNIPPEQDTYSIETFEDDEGDLYSELQTALAEDFVPACVKRMESFIEDFESDFDQT